MIEIPLDDVRGGAKAVLSKPEPELDTKGWFEQIKHQNGEVFRRDISPSGRKGRWQPVDTYWVNDP